jgi:NADH-quinone oxidoreductase subunit A
MNNVILINYVALMFYASLTFLLCLLIYIASFFFSQDGDQNVDKTTPYECGFEAFGDARDSFDIKYYLLGILFLIFDLELIYLLPWALCITKLNTLGLFSMIFFIIILTAGFIFEWKKGSLDW